MLSRGPSDLVLVPTRGGSFLAVPSRAIVPYLSLFAAPAVHVLLNTASHRYESRVVYEWIDNPPSRSCSPTTRQPPSPTYQWADPSPLTFSAPDVPPDPSTALIALTAAAAVFAVGTTYLAYRWAVGRNKVVKKSKKNTKTPVPPSSPSAATSSSASGSGDSTPPPQPPRGGSFIPSPRRYPPPRFPTSPHPKKWEDDSGDEYEDPPSDDDEPPPPPPPSPPTEAIDPDLGGKYPTPSWRSLILLFAFCGCVLVARAKASSAYREKLVNALKRVLTLRVGGLDDPAMRKAARDYAQAILKALQPMELGGVGTVVGREDARVCEAIEVDNGIGGGRAIAGAAVVGIAMMLVVSLIGEEAREEGEDNEGEKEKEEEERKGEEEGEKAEGDENKKEEEEEEEEEEEGGSSIYYEVSTGATLVSDKIKTSSAEEPPQPFTFFATNAVNTSTQTIPTLAPIRVDATTQTYSDVCTQTYVSVAVQAELEHKATYASVQISTEEVVFVSASTSAPDFLCSSSFDLLEQEDFDPLADPENVERDFFRVESDFPHGLGGEFDFARAAEELADGRRVTDGELEIRDVVSVEEFLEEEQGGFSGEEQDEFPEEQEEWEEGFEEQLVDEIDPDVLAKLVAELAELNLEIGELSAQVADHNDNLAQLIESGEADAEEFERKMLRTKEEPQKQVSFEQYNFSVGGFGVETIPEEEEDHETQEEVAVTTDSSLQPDLAATLDDNDELDIILGAEEYEYQEVSVTPDSSLQLDLAPTFDNNDDDIVSDTIERPYPLMDEVSVATTNSGIQVDSFTSFDNLFYDVTEEDKSQEVAIASSSLRLDLTATLDDSDDSIISDASWGPDSIMDEATIAAANSSIQVNSFISFVNLFYDVGEEDHRSQEVALTTNLEQPVSLTEITGDVELGGFDDVAEEEEGGEGKPESNLIISTKCMRDVELKDFNGITGEKGHGALEELAVTTDSTPRFHLATVSNSSGGLGTSVEVGLVLENLTDKVAVTTDSNTMVEFVIPSDNVFNDTGEEMDEAQEKVTVIADSDFQPQPVAVSDNELDIAVDSTTLFDPVIPIDNMFNDILASASSQDGIDSVGEYGLPDVEDVRGGDGGVEFAVEGDGEGEEDVRVMTDEEIEAILEEGAGHVQEDNRQEPLEFPESVSFYLRNPIFPSAMGESCLDSELDMSYDIFDDSLFGTSFRSGMDMEAGLDPFDEEDATGRVEVVVEEETEGGAKDDMESMEDVEIVEDAEVVEEDLEVVEEGKEIAEDKESTEDDMENTDVVESLLVDIVDTGGVESVGVGLGMLENTEAAEQQEQLSLPVASEQEGGTIEDFVSSANGVDVAEDTGVQQPEAECIELGKIERDFKTVFTPQPERIRRRWVRVERVVSAAPPSPPRTFYDEDPPYVGETVYSSPDPISLPDRYKLWDTEGLPFPRPRPPCRRRPNGNVPKAVYTNPTSTPHYIDDERPITGLGRKWCHPHYDGGPIRVWKPFVFDIPKGLLGVEGNICVQYAHPSWQLRNEHATVHDGRRNEQSPSDFAAKEPRPEHVLEPPLVLAKVVADGNVEEEEDTTTDTHTSPVPTTPPASPLSAPPPEESSPLPLPEQEKPGTPPTSGTNSPDANTLRQLKALWFWSPNQKGAVQIVAPPALSKSTKVDPINGEKPIIGHPQNVHDLFSSDLPCTSASSGLPPDGEEEPTRVDASPTTSPPKSTLPDATTLRRLKKLGFWSPNTKGPVAIVPPPPPISEFQPSQPPSPPASTPGSAFKEVLGSGSCRKTLSLAEEVAEKARALKRVSKEGCGRLTAESEALVMPLLSISTEVGIINGEKPTTGHPQIVRSPDPPSTPSPSCPASPNGKEELTRADASLTVSPPKSTILDAITFQRSKKTEFWSPNTKGTVSEPQPSQPPSPLAPNPRPAYKEVIDCRKTLSLAEEVAEKARALKRVSKEGCGGPAAESEALAMPLLKQLNPGARTFVPLSNRVPLPTPIPPFVRLRPVLRADDSSRRTIASNIYAIGQKYKAKLLEEAEQEAQATDSPPSAKQASVSTPPVTRREAPMRFPVITPVTLPAAEKPITKKWTAPLNPVAPTFTPRVGLVDFWSIPKKK